jgi:hypothetical protein
MRPDSSFRSTASLRSICTFVPIRSSYRSTVNHKSGKFKLSSISPTGDPPSVPGNSRSVTTPGQVVSDGEGQQGGCLPRFPVTFPPPVSQLRRWIVTGCIRWGSTPPCATSIPLLPHRRRRWVPPRSFHPSTTTSLTLRPKEHTGGCRPSFPLAHFSPTRDAATQLVRPVCASRC